MGGSQKAPPRPYLPAPAPLPAATRTYAHVRTFDVACPACGTVSVVSSTRGRRKIPVGKVPRAGYDVTTGILTCRGCGRPWYVGLVLWRLRPHAHRARPGDHVPTPQEAAQLLAQLHEACGTGWAKVPGAEAPHGGVKGAREAVNLVCWCGLECPAHPKGDEDVID